jgi:hypothetical protein
LSDASVGWRDEKAMTEPVASRDGPLLGSIHTPSGSPLILVIDPAMRSKTKTSASRLKSSAATRSFASDWNAMKRLSDEMTGLALAPLASPRRTLFVMACFAPVRRSARKMCAIRFEMPTNAT